MADLKPGEMGTSSEAGMPVAFAGSMAAAIEAAVDALLPGEGKDAFPLDDNSAEARDRRVLFCAIARGVVDHLRDNADAFRIHLQYDITGHVVGATVEIRTQ